MQYAIRKRRGQHVSDLPNAPKFDDLNEARAWANAYLAAQPNEFQRGLEAIEVCPSTDSERQHPT
jgi:hypothetical protein